MGEEDEPTLRDVYNSTMRMEKAVSKMDLTMHGTPPEYKDGVLARVSAVEAETKALSNEQKSVRKGAFYALRIAVGSVLAVLGTAAKLLLGNGK